jgi:hypothetical protein
MFFTVKYTTRTTGGGGQPCARGAQEKNPPALQHYNICLQTLKVGANDTSAQELQNYSGEFGDLDKYPALVLHYSEEEGAAAGVFLCTTYRGKLLQHKLIRVQCTKKSTRVPVSPVPQYGYSV